MAGAAVLQTTCVLMNQLDWCCVAHSHSLCVPVSLGLSQIPPLLPASGIFRLYSGPWMPPLFNCVPGTVHVRSKCLGSLGQGLGYGQKNLTLIRQ